MKFNDAPESSFKINNQNNRSFTLTSLIDNRNIEQFDTLKLVEYLSRYKNLNYERILDVMTKSKLDSILTLTPTFEISVTDILGKTHSLKTWKRKADFGQLDLDGNQAVWDLERMYGMLDNSQPLVSVQYFVFGDVVVPLQWFLRNNTKAQTRK